MKTMTECRAEAAVMILRGFASVRLTLYGLALDARQAEVMQRAINKIDAILKP